ncbi:MAG TPA: ABC transporter permease [Bryobacteraceae bacterium]|nr:ABC transporter permease [Bryobacteraceae bacterium]
MWRRVFLQRRLDRDLDAELQAHLEIETARLMEQGLTREEARVRARQAFGNPGLVAEATREVYSFAWLRHVLQDLRYAARAVRVSPGFSIAVVLSLALGIGASTAVFSIADTVFLRPLPYAGAERLVWVAIRFPSIKGEFLPSPDYVAWRRDNRVFEQLAATQANCCATAIVNAPDPAEIHTARVSVNFLEAFGTVPALGRTFTAEEEPPNGPKAVLLTAQFWRNHFHSRRDVLGQTIALDGQPFTIAGVLPPSFIFPMDVQVDVLTTLPVSPTASHHDRTMMTWATFGRLKPGVTVAQARANLETLFAASKADAPLFFRADNSLVVEPLQQHRVGNARMLLAVLLGAVGCLLLIACANVANLLLARWSARSRELAVRAAIGAGRARLVRQLFTETVFLTALGWIASLALVAGALSAFVHFAAHELPRLSEVAVDARVFGISLAVSLATTLVFGGLPALRAGSVDIHAVLQGAGRPGIAGGYRVLRRALVAAEIALSVMLLSGAALLLQTLWHLRNDRLGFQPDHLLSVSLSLRGTKLEKRDTETVASGILTYMRRLPGTQAAALTQCTPLSGGSMFITFSRSDRPLPEPFHRGDGIAVCGVGPDYFQAAGSRLIRGRFLAEDDYRHPDTAAIINEAAASAYFPGEDPVGKQIGGNAKGGWKTVAGVVSDSKNQGLNLPPMPQMFVNNPGAAQSSQLLFVVRSLAGEQALASEIRSELRSLDPGLFAKFETLDEAIRRITAGPRFNGILLASFAAIAFLTAMVGVYGVIAFAVAQRTQEIGIRMALGAGPRRVLALLLREGALLVAIGTAVGLGGALALNRYGSTLLYGVAAADPRTYAAVVLGLAIAAAAATSVPARRAASIDPIRALRHD